MKQEIDELLRLAAIPSKLPGSFQAGVWNRIAASREGWLARLAHPLPACAMVLITVSLGFWLGSMQNASASETKAAYVLSVSPFR